MPNSRQLESWPIADLKPHPQQAQMFNDLTDQEIENLAKDMERNGQMQPVEITSDGTIICGHQRVLAAKLLGWTQIDVVIRGDLEEAGEDAVEARLVEDNLNRRHLDPLEVARCYKRIKEIERVCKPGELSASAHSNLRDRIGTRLGMSGRNLDRYLRVLETPIAVQQAVSAGDITLVLAGKVAGLDSDMQQEIADRVQAGEPALSVVKEFVAERLERHKSAGDAFASFVRGLDRGLDDLHGRVKRIGSQSWAGESLPTLKKARRVITQIIKQVEGNPE